MQVNAHCYHCYFVLARVHRFGICERSSACARTRPTPTTSPISPTCLTRTPSLPLGLHLCSAAVQKLTLPFHWPPVQWRWHVFRIPARSRVPVLVRGERVRGCLPFGVCPSGLMATLCSACALRLAVVSGHLPAVASSGAVASISPPFPILLRQGGERILVGTESHGLQAFNWGHWQEPSVVVRRHPSSSLRPACGSHSLW